MKTKILLSIAILLMAACASLHKAKQSSTSHVDSTGSSSGKLVNTAVVHERKLDSSHFASFADMRSGWQRQTLNIQFASVPGNFQRSGNDTAAALVDAASGYLAGLPTSMLERVTGLTYTVENGKEEKQTGSTAHQNSEQLKDGRDSLSTSQQQNTHLEKKETAKSKEVARKGVSWYIWLGLGILALAGVVGWGYFKGWWGIFGLVKKKLNSSPPQS